MDHVMQHDAARCIAECRLRLVLLEAQFVGPGARVQAGVEGIVPDPRVVAVVFVKLVAALLDQVGPQVPRVIFPVRFRPAVEPDLVPRGQVAVPVARRGDFLTRVAP